MSYQIGILSETASNQLFRKVLFTGKQCQLVVMSLEPGEDIGYEVHSHVEQVIFNHSGQGKIVLDGVESKFVPGDVLIVSPGTKHNIINTGDKPLQIYTVYSPANHIDGTVHATKQIALTDHKDEAYAEKVNSE